MSFEAILDAFRMVLVVSRRVLDAFKRVLDVFRMILSSASRRDHVSLEGSWMPLSRVLRVSVWVCYSSETTEISSGTFV